MLLFLNYWFENNKVQNKKLSSEQPIVNPDGRSTLLAIANGPSTFLINGKSSFINGPKRILPKNPPNAIILEVCVFDYFVLTDKLFP